MSLPFELLLGLRYTRAKRRNHFISFIAATSIIGMALAVMVLIVVVSVMNGFEREMRTTILGAASHATISGIGNGLENWKDVAADAKKNPQVEGVAPYIDGEAMLKAGSEISGALIRGVDPSVEPGVSDIDKHMLIGKLDDLTPGDFKIVLGVELAQQLGLDMGDKVDLMIPDASVTPAGILPRFRRFTVAGIFKVGNNEFDHGLVLLNLQDAATLYRLGDKVTGVRLKLYDIFQAPRVASEIASRLPGNGIYYVSDWTRQHANYFRAVATEKTVMFLILSMLVGIAAFIILAMLVMVVQDKQSDIAILRTLGATPRSILLAFVVVGFIIGVVGTLVGVGLGVLISLNVETLMPILQVATGHQFLDPSIYYISDLPSELKSSDVIRISLMSFGLCLISTIYPAWRASRVQPAEALRYE